MKIYELEVSNYKSLNNYGLPLRFSNLNLFIGENDSGKTAMLDAIQILFGCKEIQTIDFYNPEIEIKIKARLIEVNQQYLTDAMKGICSWDDSDLIFEEDFLQKVYNYSFYEDLKSFYLEYKEDFSIIFEKTYKIENNKIKLKLETYFYYPLKQTDYINNLLNNIDFLKFMSDEIKKINNKILECRVKEVVDNVNEETDYLERLEKIDYGLGEVVFRIAKLINKRLYPNYCDWTINHDFSQDFDEFEKDITSEKFTLKSYNPFINYFASTELSSEQICKLIYKDQFEVLLNLEKTKNDATPIQDIYVFLNSHLKEYLDEKINNFPESKNYFAIVKENLISLLNKLNINKNLVLDFEFSLKKFDELKKSLEPTIKVFSIEGGREIDISNKSQGFLRKLLICDFLLQTKNLGTENENGKILLIEEPEIHMHINAQKEIIAVLKENLLESNSQVFITTHSHTMIEGMDLENIYVFQKNLISGITNIKNLKQIDIFDREEILKEIISSLGIKNTDLLFLKKVIVLLEGEHDVAFIKGLCERPEIAIDTEKILFKHTLGQANIYYYVGLGEFLNLKTMVLYDNHELNYSDKKRLQNNPFVSDKLRENTISIEILEKSDILNYFDFEFVAEYKEIPKEKLPQKNQNISMKEFLEKNNRWLNSKDVEYLAKIMPKIPKELKDKIINFLKLSLMDFGK